MFRLYDSIEIELRWTETLQPDCCRCSSNIKDFLRNMRCHTVVIIHVRDLRAPSDGVMRQDIFMKSHDDWYRRPSNIMVVCQ
jgi:hypothetical protein